MKISCIIPTHDRPEYLAAAVESVVRQTRPADEIIVVNNGSSSVRLPDNLLAQVRIHNADAHCGASVARNVGATAAHGEYLAFLDDDDLWSAHYLEQVSAALADGAGCVVSRLDRLDGDKISPFKNGAGKLDLATLLVSNPGVTGSNIVVRKDVFMQAGGFDSRLLSSEDKGLLVELIRRNARIKVLPDNQVIIRMHAGPRLSDSARLASGIRAFTKKYSSLMTTTQQLKNWLKIYWHRYRAGNIAAAFPLAVLRIILLIIKRREKST